MSLAYDQSENPRHLQSLPELQEVTPEVDLQLAREKLVVRNQSLQTTETDGWQHIAYTAQHKREVAAQRAIRAETLDELRRAQGEILALDWLLQLPESLLREQQTLRAFLAEHDQDEEGDGEG